MGGFLEAAALFQAHQLLGAPPGSVAAGFSRTEPGERPHARSELTIGPITTFARETPEEVVRAPCVERGAKEA
ncbi:hypothetical protein [Methylobacterium sp. R2-1]|uniref:hypothetical protein n=1 Tax=Methylobacterium sp. R2-1 TaxID=2587064 RepID=UPI0016211ECE|nr:hypothetical protein [Methylobacterium sp. R2-1]MBB2964460.1 hypothetical protein [Methylobacterium sp. R2-1]